MNVAAHYQSLTAELESLKDRVRNFMDRPHWLTDGEWKESVLRSTIAQRLPETIKIGRGFVLTENEPTSQCDVLLYRADCPILFRDGDLVFLTPDAVVGIIEVKSKATNEKFSEAVASLAENGRKLGQHTDHCCLAVFAYENDTSGDEWVLDRIQSICIENSQIVKLVNLGCSTFVKWWGSSPAGGDDHYRQWHAYELTRMSAGYFIANVLDAISPTSIGQNSKFWFPEDSKELRVTSRRPYLGGPHADEPRNQ